MPKPEHFFAPGVIETYRSDKLDRVDTLGRYLLTLAIIASIAACIGVIAGYIDIAGYLL